MDLSAKHGRISVTEEGRERSSDSASQSSVRVSGTSWQVNAVLLSMEYIAPQDWYGWDKIYVAVTDLGHSSRDTTIDVRTYEIALSVAAINDPPVIEINGFDLTLASDTESGATDSTTSAFLVPSKEDTVAVVTGVRVSDVDITSDGGILSRPDGFLLVVDSNGAGNGVELLASNPRIRLSISSTYGQISLGGEHAGLVAEVGDLDTGEQLLIVVGALHHINEALSEGIIYKPKQDWSGIDMVEVRQIILFGGSNSACCHCFSQCIACL